jgi:AGCS family alanine or glycine:cation symporter
MGAKEEKVVNWLMWFDQLLWSKCLIFILLAVGTLYTIRLRGMQFKYLLYSLKIAFTRSDDEAEGDISQFQALMTALAATIGIASIAGVATAITAGGFGSIFWMWIIALVGMVTKYAEGILAVKYRIVDHRGEMCGGPMYYIRRGLNWHIVAALFAFFGALSAFAGGNLTQANSIAESLQNLLNVPKIWSGIIFALLTAVVLLKGIKSIAKVCSYLVPFMAGMYILGGLIIISLNLEHVLPGLGLIIQSAFTGQAAKGGFLGAGVIAALQFGVARGISTNEAGLGSAPIAAAAAKTDVPGRQALISMSSVFISTLIVCTITALVISVTGVLGTTAADGTVLNGAALVMQAFNSVIPGGKWIVAMGIVLFGYSTIVGWAYYGEKCSEYLFGERFIYGYRILFSLIVFCGAILSLDVVWPIVDITNGLMALPNLIGLIALSGIVTAESRMFFDLLRRERFSE